ncbi:MAG TPA: dTMP kinase [Bdellovibrionales bacterium]|nr:dTMP kinase [Bdellovibrionales bacterium]
MAFVGFEGLDGSGKTSLIQRTVSHLTQSNIDALVTREPGGTPLSEEIRRLLLRTDGDAPTARCEILLYEASRAQHVDRVIKPALDQGRWVLCDRFTASTVAFQAGGRKIQETEVEWLNRFATSGHEPDLTVLLDLDTDTSLARQQKRFQATGEKADRLESEARDFHERVRQAYLRQAKTNPTKWLVLDASQTLESMFNVLLNTFQEKKWLVS